VFGHAAVPSVLPSLLGIALYRFDENLRSFLVLGLVVGAERPSALVRDCML